MKLAVILPIILVMILLRVVRAGMLLWLLVWWVGAYVFLRFGFSVPIPSSVISIYMGIITLSLLAYVTSDRKRFTAAVDPVIAFVTDRRYTLALVPALIALPAAVGASVYMKMNVPLQPPFFGRTIHPAPPDEITFKDKKINLITVTNPFRELEKSNPEQFKVHVANGRHIYYSNCFYCHGDNMAGNGMFAHGLDPIPTNFTDPGTIAMLQEGFLFWRISKGGPGMPEEGGPWASPMPAWEKFLTEQEIWEVILFLYDFTGFRPRAREEVHQ